MPQIIDGPPRKKARVKGTQSARESVKVNVRIVKAPKSSQGERMCSKPYSFVEGDEKQFGGHTFAEKQMGEQGWSRVHNNDSVFHGAMTGHIK